MAYFHAVDRGILQRLELRTKFLLSMIETSFMSVTVEDEEGHVVGFAVLDDTPLQLSATEDAGTDWEEWFQEPRDTFQNLQIDSTNSLWFSTCLMEGDNTIMAEILRTTFSTMPELQNVLVFVPASIDEDGAMKILQPFQSHFGQLEMTTEELMPMTHWAAPSVEGHPPMVLSCNRSQVIAPLGIRIARDHDNLAAVFDAQSEVVTSVYGDFFIAELIEAQNDENRALVAEVDGRAVGLMCLTSDVDINVLAQCFQLDPYDNLLKGPYMKRVREHSQLLLEGREASLCASGDFLQVALSSMDMDVLMDSIPKLEDVESKDGRINAVQLHGALQMQEFSDEVGEVLQEFEKSIMMLFWQANFLEPMLQENSVLFPSKVSECVQIFMNLDITARKAIAGEVLERWTECLHLAVFTAGLISGKSAPEWSIYVGWVFLVVGLLWRLRGLGKELDYWIAACREATFCIVAYYIDSVGVYMVAVMHERRFEHISLQDTSGTIRSSSGSSLLPVFEDNVLLLLEYLCRSEIFDGLLRRLPELNADEAALYLTACCAFYASDGRAVQAIAKLARVMRYCRLLRVLCYCSTVIPSQNQACFVNRYDETYSLTEHWREAVTHMRGGCNDLIFSGHASVLTFCVLLYQDFGAPRWLQGFLWCRLAHASMRIVQSRSHLSVDIVVAFLLALLLYHVIPKPRKDLEVFGASSLRSSALAWSSALVAVLAFLAALLAQPDAGPLSTANQARLAQVSVAPNATASPRIFCAMLHIETSRQADPGDLRNCHGAVGFSCHEGVSPIHGLPRRF
eukprot:g4508.t1